MRTTFDLPDGLYKSLKVRATLDGISLRELILTLIERGLRSPSAGSGARARRCGPPVIVPPRGVKIPAISAQDLRRIEEEEDQAKHA